METASALLDPDDVAAQFKVSVFTVRDWRKYGTGPHFIKVGKFIRYRQSDLDAWIESQRRVQTPA